MGATMSKSLRPIVNLVSAALSHCPGGDRGMKIANNNIKSMGFTLHDRGGILWWERPHPTMPSLRFVVNAVHPTECMILYGSADGEDNGIPADCLFAGECSEDKIRVMSDEMVAMSNDAVRLMLLAFVGMV